MITVIADSASSNVIVDSSNKSSQSAIVEDTMVDKNVVGQVTLCLPLLLILMKIWLIQVTLCLPLLLTMMQDIKQIEKMG